MDLLKNINEYNRVKKELAKVFGGIDGLPTDIDLAKEFISFMRSKHKEPERKDEVKKDDPGPKKKSFMQRRKEKLKK